MMISFLLCALLAECLSLPWTTTKRCRVCAQLKWHTHAHVRRICPKAYLYQVLYHSLLPLRVFPMRNSRTALMQALLFIVGRNREIFSRFPIIFMTFQFKTLIQIVQLIDNVKRVSIIKKNMFLRHTI